MSDTRIPLPRRKSAVAITSIRLERRLNLILKTSIAILAAIFAIYPILWIFSAALNPANSLVNSSLIPKNASWVNFQRLVNDPTHPFMLWIWNSVKVSAITAVISVSLCSLGAYSFSRFRYRGRRAGLVSILLVQLFPNTLSMVALFLLLRTIGHIPGLEWLGLNSLGGLILIYSGGALGFNTWLMKGFFDAIPRELDELALIDGASYLQTFWHIILPLVRPILAVIGVLSFISSYSDFLLPRVMLKSTETYTLAVGLTLFIRGQFTNQWGVFAAAALVGALPIVLIFLLLQKQLISGLATGAVKG